MSTPPERMKLPSQPEEEACSVELAAQAVSNINLDESAQTEDSDTDATESGDELSDDDSDTDSDLDEPVDESLASTIVQEIDEGIYVCLVCTFEIDRHSEIWSCQNCYRVYDIDCIRDWAIRGSSTTDQKQWRCPSCNIEHKKLPSAFTCWCGRVNNPSSDALIPFSCGNPCNKKYPHCVHSCSSVCHPGKHPECGAMGPVMNCKCGKHKQQLPCLVTPYKVGWSCGTKCETVVCGFGHTCPAGTCHLGFCAPCSENVSVRCYCGGSKQTAKCTKVIPKRCFEKENRELEFVGATLCDDVTIQYFDCNVHFEELECLPLPQEIPLCKFAPERVKSCYCGKTTAESLSRTSCTDPMPECDNVCGKLLQCGCSCRAKCHEGPCVCTNFIDTRCSCENSSYLVPCKALQQGFTPKCHHKCTASLSCRKHFHREECCSFEQVALKRERDTKKEMRNRTRSNFDDQILTMEPMHICTRTCNLLKLCGKHFCEALCHSGPCGVCLESTSDDLVCHCGKTVVPAPIRCGTTIECHEQCARNTVCGHRPEPHDCHDENKNCPRCTQLVTKKCNCGSKELTKVLCSITNVSCGKICSVKKECGHACNRACSRDCTENSHADVASCQSMCRKIRKKCPHMCSAKCHLSKKTTCDSIRCKEPVTVTCECGRMSKKLPCGASPLESTKIGTLFECDEECGRVKREEELRDVFNVSPKENDLPYPETVTSVYRRQVAWCLKMETIMRNFVSDYQDCVAAEIPARKAYHFPPMSEPQRKFIHELAAVFKLYSESQDKEPSRCVFICVTDVTAVPSITVKLALDREEDMMRKKQQLEELKLSQLDDALFNAILIQDVFFGVTKDDVEKSVLEILLAYPAVEEPKIQWIKENNFVFFDKDYKDMDKEKEDRLYMVSKSFKKTLREKLIAFDCKMCMVDEDVGYVLKVDLNNVVVTTSNEDKTDAPENSFEVLQGQELDVEG